MKLTTAPLPNTGSDQRIAFLISLLLLAALSSTVAAQLTQPSAQSAQLKMGATITKRLTGGEKHIYELDLIASRFYRVIVDQRGIDVVVTLVSGDGKMLTEVDRPNGAEGPEELVWVVTKNDRYRFEVRALNQKAIPGEYSIRISEARPSALNDQKRLAAQQAFAKGMTLVSEQKPELAQERIESFSQALTLWRDTGDSASAAYAAEQLADLYGGMRDNERAIENYKQAVALYRASGDLSREGVAHNNLGLFYSSIYQSRKALESFEQALTVRRKIGNRSAESVTLLNIGSTYWDLGEYQKALNYSFQALENFKSLGDQFGQARSLYHIGWVYFTTAEPRKAVEYLELALVLQRALGDRRELLSTLDTLARAWSNAGDRRKTLEFLEQKLVILESGGNRREIAETISTIGITHLELLQMDQALPKLQRALKLQQEGGDRREEAVTQNGLGWLYYAVGNKQQAAAHYQESLSIWRELRDSDWQSKVLCNLAELNCVMGDWKEAERLLGEALELEESELASDFLSGAEGQKKFVLEQRVRSVHLSMSINAHLAPDEKSAQLPLTTILRRKGRLLDSNAEEYSALRRESNPETAALLDQLSQQVSRQAQLKLQGPGRLSMRQYESAINDLQARIEELRLKLNASSLRFRMQTRTVTLAEVQQQLPADAALVEFTLWVPFDASTLELNKFGDIRYVAYVLFNQGNPKFIDLGDADDIGRLASKLRRLQMEPLAEISQIKSVARELDQLVMRPIRQKLTGQKRLLISPEAQLNLVPFASLVDERGEYLVKNYIISYLTSGRDLLRLQVPRQPNDPPLVVGNPDFENTVGWSSRKPVASQQSRGNLTMNLKWAPLPGTDAEARLIKKLMSTANLRLGPQATESEIKQSNAPSILHLATHGFFLTDSPVEEPSLFRKLLDVLTNKGNSQPENPMLRSGLVLAGANQKRSGADDGLLTAMEVAALNLWGTKLVVMSACQTGVGDLASGEGVYGLRRAIVLAGAEAQVMTLWKVDDKITAKLMVDYYTHLLHKGAGRSDALREVQLAMLEGENKHPYFWAAFIESGAWTPIRGK